jgi:HD-GYP domain-containing protein (c-di-GMP phosphodiesterase class II)
MGDLLCAFAYASDLAFGLQFEDSLRSCYLATRLAQELGVSQEDVSTSYYTALLKDAGCTSWTSELAAIWQTDEIVARRELILFTDFRTAAGIEAWVRRYVAPDLPLSSRQSHLAEVIDSMPQVIIEAITNTADVAGRISRRLGLSESVQSATRHLFELWDGSGAPEGLQAEQIPMASRIVLVSFFAIPISRVHGHDAAISALKQGAGSTFDPVVVAAFERLSQQDEFWAGLEGDRIHERVLALEPASAMRDVGDERVDDIALAFADFIDLKSRFAAAHSRRVSKVAEQLARLMSCAPEAVVQIRRAALMHDLGIAAVPSFFLEKPEDQLSEGEWDQYRLHPYHGERILSRVPTLSPYAEMVGNHQERLNGSGYYRGLRSPNISLGSRIIAVADRLDELTHDSPGKPAISVAAAVDLLSKDDGLDAAIIGALRQAVSDKPGITERPYPAGLTQREVEVLRLAARGLTRAQIGSALHITENTVRHHLEHIYGKTGTRSRVTATLFAIENDLVD